jgi:hypothetical protein
MKWPACRAKTMEMKEQRKVTEKVNCSGGKVISSASLPI